MRNQEMRRLRAELVAVANHYDALLGEAMVMDPAVARKAARLNPAQRAKLRAEKAAALDAVRAELAEAAVAQAIADDAAEQAAVWPEGQANAIARWEAEAEAKLRK